MATGTGFNELLLQQHQFLLQQQSQQRLMAMAAGMLQNANPTGINFPFLQGIPLVLKVSYRFFPLANYDLLNNPALMTPLSAGIAGTPPFLSHTFGGLPKTPISAGLAQENALSGESPLNLSKFKGSE